MVDHLPFKWTFFVDVQSSLFFVFPPFTHTVTHLFVHLVRFFRMCYYAHADTCSHLSSQLLLPHQRQLARAVRSAASAARLRDLAKTYVAVPLADLASKTGMSPAEVR